MRIEKFENFIKCHSILDLRENFFFWGKKRYTFFTLVEMAELHIIHRQISKEI